MGIGATTTQREVLFDYDKAHSVLKTTDALELYLLRAYLKQAERELETYDFEQELVASAHELVIPHIRFGTNNRSAAIHVDTLQKLDASKVLTIFKRSSDGFHIYLKADYLHNLIQVVEVALKDITPSRQAIKFSVVAWATENLPEYSELINLRNGQHYGAFGDTLNGEIARCLHQKWSLGESISYDTIWEELHPEWVNTHGQFLESKPGTARREAIRQAGVRLNKAAVKYMGVDHYIITFKSSLMRVS